MHKNDAGWLNREEMSRPTLFVYLVFLSVPRDVGVTYGMVGLRGLLTVTFAGQFPEMSGVTYGMDWLRGLLTVTFAGQFPEVSGSHTGWLSNETNNTWFVDRDVCWSVPGGVGVTYRDTGWFGYVVC